MRAAPALICCLLLIAGCGAGQPKDPKVRTAGTLTATFAAVPDPPTVGHDNGFAVTLTEGAQPVTHAQVNLALVYKALNKDGPTATCMESSAGRYEANDLSTPMNGSWEAEVTVARANQPNVKLTFPFTVSK